jgi:hypothetical protein
LYEIFFLSIFFFSFSCVKAAQVAAISPSEMPDEYGVSKASPEFAVGMRRTAGQGRDERGMDGRQEGSSGNGDD